LQLGEGRFKGIISTQKTFYFRPFRTKDLDIWKVFVLMTVVT